MPNGVDVRRHELRRLQLRGAVERDDLVERPVRRALRAGAVVADDHVDERVLEDPEILERVDEPPDVVVGVLHEARVDLHLAREHRLEVLGQVVPRADLIRPSGQLRVGGDHAELLLTGERLLADRVPAGVEAALVLGAPLLRRVMRRVRRARREVHEERLVGHQGLLLTDPGDRLVGQVLGEVVALLRRLRRLDRRHAVVERRVVLVRLGADEAVEVLEAAARAATGGTGPPGSSPTPGPRGTCRAARCCSR